MSEKPFDSWRGRAAVSEALEPFDSIYLQELWTKALARREYEPESAITSARTLLESVCKHILDHAEREYSEKLTLPQLYNLTADVLELAPNEKTEPIFDSLFKACAEVIRNIGTLRNKLSDSHGRGSFGTMPDWRHAELAVNLSGAMAIYLAAIWKGRQPTVGEVIREFLASPEGQTQANRRSTMEKITTYPIANVIASKLRASDLVAHWETRLSEGVQPQTVMHDIGALRRALGGIREIEFDKAMTHLRAKKLVARFVPRERVPTDREYDALIDHFRAPPKKMTKKWISMVDIMEFAVWSGRSIKEICSLRWEDVDFENHTCKLPGSDEAFPVLEKAWDVIVARKNADPSKLKDRIFPYEAKSVGAKHTRAKNYLKEHVGVDLVFNDMRYEAIRRLFGKNHEPYVVAKATGQGIEKVSLEYEKFLKAKELNNRAKE